MHNIHSALTFSPFIEIRLQLQQATISVKEEDGSVDVVVELQGPEILPRDVVPQLQSSAGSAQGISNSITIILYNYNNHG